MNILETIGLDTYILLNQITLFLVASLSLYWGINVYFQNTERNINKLFFFVSFLFTLWPLFGYLSFFSAEKSQAFLWLRLAYATVAVFVVCFYYLFVYFLDEKSQHKLFETFVVTGGISMILLSFFTETIIKDVKIMEVGIKPDFGLGAYLFYAFALIIFLFIFSRLMKEYRNSSSVRKAKIQYFFIGTGIFLFLNIIFNILVPAFRESYEMHQLGNYAPIFFIGFSAYAFTKEDLFNVKAALTTIFVGLISVLLGVDLLFFTTELWIQIVKAVVILIFLGFGYELVRSVIREIQQKEELERLSDELVETNAQLKKANRKLKRLDKAKSEFISIASHQLRTPLTSIKGYLSMLLEGNYGDISEEAKDKIKDILQSSERLINLVNDLLNVSRIESGEIEMHFEKVNIIDFVKQSMSELKGEAQEKDLYLDLETDCKKNLEIEIDPSRLEQAVLNILDNAIKYTEEGGVTIIIEKDELNTGKEGILIQIQDTGAGMTQEDINDIFESFSRGSAGDLIRSEGAGLGVYIAKKFVDMHNGSIWIESEGKGEGSCFFIQLPVKQEADTTQADIRGNK